MKSSVNKYDGVFWGIVKMLIEEACEECFSVLCDEGETCKAFSSSMDAAEKEIYDKLFEEPLKGALDLNDGRLTEEEKASGLFDPHPHHCASVQHSSVEVSVDGIEFGEITSLRLPPSAIVYPRDLAGSL